MTATLLLMSNIDRAESAGDRRAAVAAAHAAAAAVRRLVPARRAASADSALRVAADYAAGRPYVDPGLGYGSSNDTHPAVYAAFCAAAAAETAMADAGKPWPSNVWHHARSAVEYAAPFYA